MRYRLRTLMIVLAILPSVLAFAWGNPQAACVVAVFAAIWLAEVVALSLTPMR